MSDFESISKGLNEALKFAQGHTENSVIHNIEIPEIDVVAVRKKTGMSQSEFARSIGVAKATLLNWEQGRRNPTGPAQVLLAMIERKPMVVQELLR